MDHTCNKDINGREYAHINSIKTGDKLEVDDGFTCMTKGDIKEIFHDESGFYVKCNGSEDNKDKEAEHYLHGQQNDAGYLTGMYKVEPVEDQGEDVLGLTADSNNPKDN